MYYSNQYAIYVSSGTSTDDQNFSGSIIQLSRVQSHSWGLNIPRNNQSYLNEDVENYSPVYPTVDVTIEYYPTAGANERALGLVTDGFNSAFYGLNREKNLYFLANDDFRDVNLDLSPSTTVIAFGNALMQGYSLAAAVGGFVKATTVFSALNVQTDTGHSGRNTPAVNPETATRLNATFTLQNPDNQISQDSINTANDVMVIGPKDIIMQFPTGSVFATIISGTNSVCLQSFNLAFSIQREPVHPLGYELPSSRRVVYPIQVELSAEAILDRYQVQSLNSLPCWNSGHDINILLKQPCSDSLALEFYLRGLELESQSFSSQVPGGLTSVTFNWKGTVGDLRDSGNNLFIKAHHGSINWAYSSSSQISGQDVNGDFYMSEQIIYTRTSEENTFFSGQYV